MHGTARVTLLVGGSIAAYKSAELVRQLRALPAEVHVAMSKSAQEFISPLTLQTLAGKPVTTELFDVHQEAEIGHIRLADNADAILVAPATADIIAKVAQGIADDVVTSVLLATKKPILFAPAMNVNMWDNPVTQSNVELLKGRGYHFVEPEEGELACGWYGPGRLAETESIVDRLQNLICSKDLVGSHVLVAAGTTREWIDPIRFVANRSTGKMGYAVARMARNRGATVSLVTGPTTITPPNGVDLHRVSTAVEMREKVMELAFQGQVGEVDSSGMQLVFMVAAVADHRPAEVSPTKIKKSKDQSYSIEMLPNPDILQELGQARSSIQDQTGRKCKLIGFAAETGDQDELIASAQDKLQQKGADVIVGNFADDSFEKNTNRVWLIDKGGRQEEIATADKALIADKIISAALRA